MTATISLPLWLLVLIGVLALWAALDRLLIPGARWMLRRRVNRVIDEINERLQLRIQPFKLTKRQVLIDRLMFDGAVLEAVEAHAQEAGVPRESVMAEVGRYAREIVPSFNAYLYFRVGYWLARRVAQALYQLLTARHRQPSRIACSIDLGQQVCRFLPLPWKLLNVLF